MSTEETLDVVLRHATAMRISVEAILADYADDAVVVTNMIDQPAVGTDQIRALIGASVKELKPLDAPHATVLVRKAEGDYLMQALEDGGKLTVETFVVKDGKIVFESVFMR